MPEIAEIARVVHFLRLHLVGKTIKHVEAIDDASVFGKVGTTGAKVAAALTGKKVLSAGTQGKYFWLILDQPPHPVMHFGMTGWIHIKGDRTAYTNYYKRMKPEEMDLWPPKFWKFHLTTEGPSPAEVAFTDPRRFGRVRLVDCPGDKIRKHSPLVENGPDPVVDADVFTEAYLRGRMRSRHVPIKALLLDQTVLSGVGNWVADEVLYHARLHPEQYCDELGDEKIGKLYESIRYVCQFAVDQLGDSDRFPPDWLFHYRWGKGQKGAVGHLPSGEKLAFLTVGGRTSCYVPSLQKKSGHIAPGVKEEPVESAPEETKKPNKAAKPKVPKAEPRDDQKPKRNIKVEEDVDEPPAKKRGGAQKKASVPAAADIPKPGKPAANGKVAESGQRRRSSRLRGNNS
ncbi:hypothetical protein VTJ83DRAFT_7279 [Remersonia thermophila]|uniref:Formamidopyrimidine-DNA glycosylase catalytic domain-containing protein n=1 Tax=Remersonia thermophila TaxID=72144 RepID=A0ABR4D429_9PEZI